MRKNIFAIILSLIVFILTTINIYAVNINQPKQEISDTKITDGNMYTDYTVSSYGLDTIKEIINGDLHFRTIAENSKINNVLIKRDLYIGSLSKNVVLDNVQVDGTLYINGGTELSLKNCKINKMAVENRQANINIRLTGSKIETLNLVTSTTITDDLIKNNFFTDDLILKYSIKTIEIDENAGVHNYYSIKANLENLNINGSYSYIDFLEGRIMNLLINKDVVLSEVYLSEGTSVNTLEVQGYNNAVIGKGSIKIANVMDDKLVLQKFPSVLEGIYKPIYFNTQLELYFNSKK